MHSRAYILLKTEVEEFQWKRNEGISAVPLTEDLMKWRAKIEGLQNSIWEGFVLDLAIDFTPEYNLVPPVVKFLTIPFHPNVDPYTGQPSIDFLDSPDKWNTNYTLSSILLALQVLLSNPILENPVNLEAAQLLIRNESLYRTVIQKLFEPVLQRSKSNPELPEHVKFGLTKYRFARENKSPESSSNRYIQRKVAAPSPTELSYDSVESETEYYQLPQEWKNENWPEETESGESWEEEVDKIVDWTNSLEVDSLDYEN